MRISQEKQEKIIKMYENGDSKKTISVSLGMDSRTVTTVLTKNKIYQRPLAESVRRYNKDDAKDMIKRYSSGEKINEISKIYGISRNTFTKLAREYGIKTRKRSDYTIFNDNFFDVIDAEGKAYLLGLLYADGYNNDRGIVLVLQHKDWDILNRISEIIEHSRGPKLTKMNQWYLGMFSERFSKRCSELGCHRKKSLTLRFPKKLDIPTDLMNHFIRGYFDGDGCISGGKTPTMTIVSSIYFCEGLNEELSSLVGRKNLENHPNNNITKRYRFSGARQISKFYDYIYKGATIFIERKRKKFKAILGL